MEEFAKIKQEEQALLEAELARKADVTPSSTPRWRMNVRIFCASHSIRGKTLKIWNDSVQIAKLKFVNSGEILLEFTLGEHVNIADLFGAGQSLSKLVVSCLSIGSAGYFWHELPATSAEYFEKVEDLANPNMKVDIRGGFNLQRHWLGGDETPKLIVLEERHLQHAAICAVATMSLYLRRYSWDGLACSAADSAFSAAMAVWKVGQRLAALT